MQNNQFLLNAHLPSPQTLHFTRPNNVCLFVQDKPLNCKSGFTLFPLLFYFILMLSGPVSTWRLSQTKLAFAITCDRALLSARYSPPATHAYCSSLSTPSNTAGLLGLQATELSTQLGVSFGHTSFVFIVLRFQHGVPVGPTHRPELSPEGGRGSPNYLKDHHKSAMLLPPTATASHHPLQSSAPNGKRAKLSPRLRL